MEMIEIIIFAMIAAFVALRLFSALGTRPEEEVDPPRPMPTDKVGRGPVALDDDETPAYTDRLAGIENEDLRPSLDAIAKQDRSFIYKDFKAGASAAYEMILEGFWKGERGDYEPYVSKDIAADFNAALESRRAEGLTIENRLIDIDKIEMVSAALEDKTAEITMSFNANIVAVTRNAEGEVVDGSLSDTYQTRDVWTFSRAVNSRNPNWTVVATESIAP